MAYISQPNSPLNPMPMTEQELQAEFEREQAERERMQQAAQIESQEQMLSIADTLDPNKFYDMRRDAEIKRQAQEDYEAGNFNTSEQQAYIKQLAAEWENLARGGTTNGVNIRNTSTGSGFGRSAYGFDGVVTGQASHKGKSPYGLNTTFWNALSSAFGDMERSGLGRPGITDGFRSYAQQVDLKKRKPTLAAKAGYSVHGLGLAADLDLNSKQLKWLQTNGAKYGLVQLPSETWHWQLMPSWYKGSGAGAPTRSAESYTSNIANPALNVSQAQAYSNYKMSQIR